LKVFCFYLTFFCYFCSDFPHSLCWVIAVLSGYLKTEQLTPCWERRSLRMESNEAGNIGKAARRFRQRWEAGNDIERRLRRFVKDVSKSCNQSIAVLNLATVDVLGMCLYASPLPIWSTNGVRRALGYYIHIGVGSNVVCSTAIGNARASTRGTDNSDSTLFLCQASSQYKKGPIWAHCLMWKLEEARIILPALGLPLMPSPKQKAQKQGCR